MSDLRGAGKTQRRVSSQAIPASRHKLGQQRLDHALGFGMQSRGAGLERRSEQARLVDNAIRTIFTDQLLPDEGLAVVAYGAYGRCDMGPASPFHVAVLWDDSRSMFTLEHAPSKGFFDPQALASHLWLGLWETGASFHRSVYSLAQCDLLTTLSVTDALGFLDLRTVWGDAALVQHAKTRVLSAWESALHDTFCDIARRVEQRGAAYPALGHSGEPNLVLDRGGLKDAAIVRALKRVLEREDTQTGQAKLNHHVHDAIALVQDVRDALHVVRGNNTGRLLQGDQAAVAGMVGFSDVDELVSAVELAGRTVTWELRRTLDTLRMQRGDSCTPARVLPLPWKTCEAELTVDRGRIAVSGQGQLSRIELLTAFHCATETGMTFADSFFERAKIAALDTAGELTNPERDLLLRSLSSPHVLAAWEGCDVHGITTRWIPGWSDVRGKIVTVEGQRIMLDRHIVLAGIAASRLARDYARSRPELHVWAAMMHWCDPFTLKLIASFLGVSRSDTDMIAVAVREHRVFAATAETHDLMDSAAIVRLSDRVEDSTDVLELIETLVIAQSESLDGGLSPWRYEKVDFLLRSVRATIEARRGHAPHDDRVQRCLVTLKGVNPQVARLAMLGAHSAAHVGLVVTPEEENDGSRHLVVAFSHCPHALLALTAMAAEFGIELVSGSFTVNDSMVLSAWWVRPRGNALAHPSVLREFLSKRLGFAPVRASRAVRRTPPSPRVEGGRFLHATVTEFDSGNRDVRAFQITAEDRPRLVGDLVSAVSSYPVEITRAHVVRLESHTVFAAYMVSTLRGGISDELVTRMKNALERAAHRG